MFTCETKKWVLKTGSQHMSPEEIKKLANENHVIKFCSACTKIRCSAVCSQQCGCIVGSTGKYHNEEDNEVEEEKEVKQEKEENIEL
jgi:hypothetical protein